MHRTQILLQEEQYRILGLEAKRTGISVSALIRNLVDTHFRGRDNIREDSLEIIIGIGTGTGEAAGKNHNHLLYGYSD